MDFARRVDAAWEGRYLVSTVKDREPLGAVLARTPWEAAVALGSHRRPDQFRGQIGSWLIVC